MGKNLDGEEADQGITAAPSILKAKA